MSEKGFDAYLLVIYELQKIAIYKLDNKQTCLKELNALNALNDLRPQLENTTGVNNGLQGK